MAATTFALYVEQTQANLEQANEVGTSLHNNSAPACAPAGCMMALGAAIASGDAARQAAALTLSANNAATQRFSMATMQNAEASNASALTT